MVINGLAICAGVAGIELGLKDVFGTNYRTICYIEQESYTATTLVARMEEAALDIAPIWDNITTFDSKPWRGAVDFITAGYPCQPFSTSGKKLGTKDERWLWQPICQTIEELQPFGIFIENVARHIRVGFDKVCGDLEHLGYKVKAGLFKSYEVGARHKRERLFALAYSNGIGPRCPMDKGGRKQPWAEFVRSCFSEGIHCPQCYGLSKMAWFKNEPKLGRVVNGPANRMDRARLIGNAVMPQMAAYAFLTLNIAHLQNGAKYD